MISLNNLHGGSLDEALEISTNNKRVITNFNAYVSFFKGLTKI
jgi:hypothetical protein